MQVAVLGAGVMGSALGCTVAERGHKLLLVGSPMEEEAIAEMERTRRHAHFDVPLPPLVEPIPVEALSAERLQACDLVVLAVSNVGIDWAVDVLSSLLSLPIPLLVLTKGLRCRRGCVQTLPEYVAEKLAPIGDFPTVDVGGACIAHDLAVRCPTCVLYAGTPSVCRWLQQQLSSDYYHIAISTDGRGVALCAALKNFLAIGIEAVYVQAQRALPRRNGVEFGNNALAAAMAQGTTEMAKLIVALGGERETVWGRAGVGDLYVTIGNGRNAKLGACLGRGMTLEQAFAGALQGETVEGVGVGRVLQACLESPQGASLGALLSDLPLTRALLDTLCDKDLPFAPQLENFA